MINITKTARVAALLLVLCMVSMVMIGGTFAKYTSEYAGQDTALIARWKIVPKGGQTEDGALALGSSSSVDLNLFSHAYNTNILATAGSQKIVAPGVKGSFVINVKNEGDVAAKMTFNFAVNGTEINGSNVALSAPLQYSLNGSNGPWVNLATLKSNLEAISEMDNLAAATGNKTVTVHWYWPYNAAESVFQGTTDATDTDKGVASAAGANRTEYKLSITAKAEQKTPGTN